MWIIGLADDKTFTKKIKKYLNKLKSWQTIEKWWHFKTFKHFTLKTIIKNIKKLIIKKNFEKTDHEMI